MNWIRYFYFFNYWNFNFLDDRVLFYVMMVNGVNFVWNFNFNGFTVDKKCLKRVSSVGEHRLSYCPPPPPPPPQRAGSAVRVINTKMAIDAIYRSTFEWKK